MSTSQWIEGPGSRPLSDRGRRWPHQIAILNDYVRIPYANGSSFASQFLYREFTKRGSTVTIVGPHDPTSRPEQLPDERVELPSLPLKNHPGVYLPLPTARVFDELSRRKLDIVLGQTGSELAVLGTWLRAARRVPFLCVNTIHLPSVYNVILPDRVNEDPRVRQLFDEGVVPWLERHSAQVYNQGDGLIVLSVGLADYWRKRGVTVPIHVIPRAIERRIFDAAPARDPFDARAKPGTRLLVVCRHTREKNVTRLLELFARWIAPALPEVTLTLVGDGPDHESFRQIARALGVEERCFFPGEHSIHDMPAFYAHADLFVYTSLSETYGQVVSEALWCGLPVVALADGMGVSQQIDHDVNGVLVSPSSDERAADWRFGNEVLALLRDHSRRRRLADGARRLARSRSDPDLGVARYYTAFSEAARHCRQNRPNNPGFSQAFPIARWLAVHGLLAALGCVRKPARVNRHQRSQIDWSTVRSCDPAA
jgi:1,2-diacylglycerol 3-alpha-glucosyltransferase